MGGSQDSSLEPYYQVVQVGEGWVDLVPVLLKKGEVAKWANMLLDKTINKYFNCRWRWQFEEEGNFLLKLCQQGI
jgi:hypothetical protein